MPPDLRGMSSYIYGDLKDIPMCESDGWVTLSDTSFQSLCLIHHWPFATVKPTNFVPQLFNGNLCWCMECCKTVTLITSFPSPRPTNKSSRVLYTGGRSQHERSIVYRLFCVPRFSYNKSNHASNKANSYANKQQWINLTRMFTLTCWIWSLM